MQLYGRQRQGHYLNQELADRVKDLAVATLGAGLNAEAVAALASHACSLADHLMTYFETHNQLPHPIACREGCDACCYNQVEVTPPEALGIGRWVAENLAPEARAALLQRVSRALSFKAGKTKEEIARLRQKLPCPLLQEGRCLAYDVRPLVCRAMHGFNASACEAELRQGEPGTGEFYAHRYEFVWSISAGLKAGCRELGCPSGVMDLDEALNNFFSTADPLEQWIQGGEVFLL